ncbi:MAG: outer membrane lipoprotein carrier protein LolA [Candidatus Binatia bacterium]
MRIPSTRLSTFLTLVCGVLGVLAALAAPAATNPSLATRAAGFAAVKTATAVFAQEREVSLVDEVLHANGRLTLAAPSSVRLDLEAPEKMALVAAGTTMTVVDAQGKTLPIPPEVAGLAAFARTLTDLLLGSRAPSGFREEWRDADTVVLKPEGDVASPFSEITLRFPANGPLPEEVALRERGGDRTTIRLRDIVLNPPLDPTRFAPSAAKGSPSS